MKTHEPSPFFDFLRDEFLKRKRRNTTYSVSAYARDLGVSQPFLSRLMNRQRRPTVKVAVQVAAVCDVSNRQTEEWISSIILTSPPGAKVPKKMRAFYEKRSKTLKVKPFDCSASQFKAISQWYHLAILYLTYNCDFRGDSSWIARRLGITRIEADEAFNRLLELGWLKREGDQFQAIHPVLSVNAKRAEIANREFHKQMGQKAIEAMGDLSDETFDRQIFSGVTFAIPKTRISEFREKVQSFQKEVLSMLESETYSDVYQLNLQLFPLTKPLINPLIQKDEKK